MKNILIVFSISLIFGLSCHSQVIINGDESESGIPTLKKGDLDIRGNLKVNHIQPIFYKVDNKPIEKIDLRRLFLNKSSKFISTDYLLQNIVYSLTYYIKIENGGYNIAQFNTKIPVNDYITILGQYDLINDDPKEYLNPNYRVNSPKTGYQSVKEGKLFELNGNWAFSANYTGSESSTSSLWKVVIYAVKKDFIKIFTENDTTPSNTISYIQPEYKESIKGVGIGTDSPTEILDIANNVRIKSVKEETNDSNKNKLMPILIDEDGILRTGRPEKVAFPVKLNINLLGDNKDFLYYLRLGLDPEKYTPVLANYRLICKDANNENFSSELFYEDQPVLNNLLRVAKTNGVADWELYMDYYGVIPKGCENTAWEATLLVFRNTYIKNIPLNNDFENPYLLNQTDYDPDLKGYVGEVSENPNF